jgi:hypothetical protein
MAIEKIELKHYIMIKRSYIFEKMVFYEILNGFNPNYCRNSFIII